jgi:hypothetical protein
MQSKFINTYIFILVVLFMATSVSAFTSVGYGDSPLFNVRSVAEESGFADSPLFEIDIFQSSAVIAAQTLLQLDAWPNPFNSATSLVCDIGRREVINIDIFDIRGRRVRSLLTDAGLETGRHQIEWNGLDDTSRPLPSGVYFCRLSTNDREIRKRMMLIK